MIIGYLRVSTGKQNPANQQDEIRRFADSRNLSVSQWVTEVASGKKKGCDRKLGGLIRRMKRGDTLIVTEVSRLSRTLTDLMAIMGKCLEKGINLYTTKEGYSFDNSINSKVLCFAFGLVAEIERNLISQRTKEALARKKVQGAKLGRPKGERPETCKLKGKEEMILQYIKEHKTKVYISKKLGVNRQTLREFLKTHPEIPRKWKRIQKD